MADLPLDDDAVRRAKNREKQRRYKERHPDRVKATKKKYRETHVEQERERERNRPPRTTWDYKHTVAYRERYPERVKARSAVQIALKSGRLSREPCEVCGEPIVEAHHEDYDKPLEVRWLCTEHHLSEHGKSKRG